MHLGFDEYDVANQGLISHHCSIVKGRAPQISVPFRYVAAVRPRERSELGRRPREMPHLVRNPSEESGETGSRRVPAAPDAAFIR